MLKREVTIALDAIRARSKDDDDLVVPLAMSSELPVERWWGVEILDHGEKSVRLGRLNDGAPVLYSHDHRDHLGTHEPGSVKVGKDRVLRGDIRIAPVDDRTRSMIKKIEKRILTKASVGYRIHEIVEITTKRDGTVVERVIDGHEFERLLEQYEERGSRDFGSFRRDLTPYVREVKTRDAAPEERGKDDDEEPIYRAMDWEPIENSLVTIPADNTVGIGRSKEQHGGGTSPSTEPAASSANFRRTSVSTKTEAELAAEREAAEQERKKRERDDLDKKEREAREELARKTAMEHEGSRKRAIENICKMNGLDDQLRQMWISGGTSVEQVSTDVLKILEERGKSAPKPGSMLGLTSKEAQRFSFTRAITAVADNDWSKAGFELECSREVAKKLGRTIDPKNFLVPFEVMQRPVDQVQANVLRALLGMEKRDLTVATAGAGGFLVETENVGFIEILRNRSVAFSMGVRRLSGLTGNVTVPRQSAAATAFWLSTEATAITESQQTFVQMALSPKNVGAYTEISRQLLLQSSPGAEGIVTDDLAQVVAIAADLAVLEGSGAAGQPTGLANTAGIGNVAAGAASYAKVLEFQEDVATSNVRPARGGYVTHPATASILMQKQRFTSTDTPLWVGNIWDGQVSGFPAMSSNQLASGVIDFGDWQEIVVGEWGVLEVSVNPYANFPAGIIGVRAIYSLDVGVRRPFAFSRATGITA